MFAGWIDVALSEHGKQQAERSGALIAACGFLPDVVHTSVQRRAVVTADQGGAGHPAAGMLMSLCDWWRAWFVVDELSLYRCVGSPQIMTAQMGRRLSAVAAMPKMTLR